MIDRYVDIDHHPAGFEAERPAMLDLERPAPITSHLLDQACESASIQHGFFTRSGGVSQGIYRGLNVGLGSDDDPRHINENRARVAQWFKSSSGQLATPNQIHSSDVFIADRALDGQRPRADAMVTATPGIVIGILTADCGPILFADPMARVVGAAHAGWKGAMDGIVEQTVEHMEQLGASRARITACLGPSISGKNYQVGPEFVDRFVAHDPQNLKYFSSSDRKGHRFFDLQKYTLARLAAAGISAHSSGHCTYADEENFFSYRRTTHKKEPDYGRQISAISIVDGGQRGPTF